MSQDNKREFPKPSPEKVAKVLAILDNSISVILHDHEISTEDIDIQITVRAESDDEGFFNA